MARTRVISSQDNPFYKGLLRLAGAARERKRTGHALLDGVHLIEAYHASGGAPLHLIVAQAALTDRDAAKLLEKLPGVPITQVSDSSFAKLSELKTPTGILALIEQRQPTVPATHSCFALLLEDIQDPGNLGSMIRSAAAAGCDAVFLSRGCADAWSPKVLRAGMGGHFLVNIYEAADLTDVALHFRGTVYAAFLAAEKSLYDCRLVGEVAFAIGNEGAGLSEDLLRVTCPVAIPMPGKVESLNAAAAAAVCLFEASRQRN